jgi:hypothetical protein
MNHTTCTILQYAAILRGHSYSASELQEEIIATLEAIGVEDGAHAPLVAAGVTDKATLQVVEVQAILCRYLILPRAL